MAYVAALFFASVKSCLKKTCFVKMYGICCFSLNFSTLWKCFAEISLILKNICKGFQNNGTKGKTGCFFYVPSFFLLVSFHFISRSTTFENFSRGVF